LAVVDERGNTQRVLLAIDEVPRDGDLASQMARVRGGRQRLLELHRTGLEPWSTDLLGAPALTSERHHDRP
jgi:hypothetical protein